MVAILSFVVLLLVLVLVHEAGHAAAARASGCRVEEFGFGLPPRIAGKRIGETLYSLNALPIGGFVRITGEDDLKSDDPRSFATKPRWKRALVLSAGVLANLLLAVVVFSLVAVLGVDVPIEGLNETIAAKQHGQLADQRIVIIEVSDALALHRAGLQPNDVLLAVDGTPVSDAADGARRVRAFSGSQLLLTVQRDRAVKELTVEFSPPKRVEEKIGIALLDIGTVRVPWYKAPSEGVKMTGRAVRLTWSGISRIIRDAVVERKAPEDLAGPVGIASLTGIVAERGPRALLEFTGVLSVNLALVNALPIPALDGGRLLFLALESLGLTFLRGRPERLAHTIGFAMLLLLLVLITIGDVRRLAR